MAHFKVRDDVIWASHIEGDAELQERVMQLRERAVIELEVDGIVGRWQKLKTGRDGRPTNAIKPVGPMREVWKQFQQRRGEIVPIRETQTADRYLASLQSTLTEWDSPEDEEAFRGL
jgi:hypothetical protein